MAIDQNLITELQGEHDFAISHFAPFHSAHEGYAVLLEELEELKAEVFKPQSKRSTAKLRLEALQVAAMGLRFIIDICDK